MSSSPSLTQSQVIPHSLSEGTDELHQHHITPDQLVLWTIWFEKAHASSPEQCNFPCRGQVNILLHIWVLASESQGKCTYLAIIQCFLSAKLFTKSSWRSSPKGMCIYYPYCRQVNESTEMKCALSGITLSHVQADRRWGKLLRPQH